MFIETGEGSDVFYLNILICISVPWLYATMEMNTVWSPRAHSHTPLLILTNNSGLDCTFISNITVI